jgi:hypothetical protein
MTITLHGLAAFFNLAAAFALFGATCILVERIRRCHSPCQVDRERAPFIICGVVFLLFLFNYFVLS